jgi:hypothetical protein
VEVAVADMAHDGSRYAATLKVLFGLKDALGKAADRHAYVRRPADRTGTQIYRRIIGFVPGLPELRALLGQVRPFELAAAIHAGDLASHGDLFLDVERRAVEFEGRRRSLPAH